jgi:hypothetical protein
VGIDMKKVLNISVVVLVASFAMGHLAYANPVYNHTAGMSVRRDNFAQRYYGQSYYDDSDSDSESESDSKPIKVSILSCMWNPKPKSTGEVKAKKVEVSNRKSKSFHESLVELKNSWSGSISSGSARSSQ